MNDKIFGYDWEDIQRAQRGGSLSKAIPDKPQENQDRQFIYKALQVVPNCIPRQTKLVKQCSTERELIAWLENNGGGIYRNVLHNFEFYVPPKS